MVARLVTALTTATALSQRLQAVMATTARNDPMPVLTGPGGVLDPGHATIIPPGGQIPALETITVTMPAAQVAGTAFTVTGTYANGLPAALDWSLGGGIWTASTGAAPSGGTFSIPGVVVTTVNASQTVQVRDRVLLNIIGTSAPFAVTAAAAATPGTMLATFAGAAGSVPVGVVAATGALPTLDGAGHLPLPANSQSVWLPALASDGLYTITLAAPSLLSFLIRSNAISASPSGYYTDGASIQKVTNGGWAGTVAGSGAAPASSIWTASMNGPVLTFANANSFSLTATDSTYLADGYLSFSTKAQSALVVSVLYQTFAQADAAYLAAHPLGMTITGVG